MNRLYSMPRPALILLLLALALVVAACGGSAPAPAPVSVAPTATPPPMVEGMVAFQVVSADSSATYIVQEEFFADALAKLGINAGKTEVYGVSQAVSGFIQLDLGNLENALGPNRFSVDLTVLRTDQSNRDKWIQEDGPRFGSFPLAEFVAASIQGGPATYTEGQEVTFQLVGDLTIRGVTRPATFDVTASLADGVIRGTATAALKMSDFGIDPPSFANTLTVQDDFQVRLDLVASR